MTEYTAADLVAFEDEITAEFNAGNIAAPVHLAGGNEHNLIELFKQINPNDWKLCSWRSHFHCLLSGVPRDEVKAAIIAGRSIALCFPAHRLLSSAIVGGICPIAVGLGWSIKQRGGSEKVVVFIGDMTAETGIYHECAKYCEGHRLPVAFVVEDNGKSVCTDTGEVWGASAHRQRQVDPWHQIKLNPDPPRDWKPLIGRDCFWNTKGYKYELTKPHVGSGLWVRF